MNRDIRQENKINKRKVKNNRRFVNFIVIVVLISMIYFTFTLVRTRIEYKRINAQLDELIAEKKSLEVELESLKESYENRESLEFAEEVAREKLGMLKAKEYIVKDKENKED